MPSARTSMIYVPSWDIMLATIWKSLMLQCIAFCARRNTWTKPQSAKIFKLRAIGHIPSCFLSRPRPASARPTGNSLWRGQTVMPPHGMSGVQPLLGPSKVDQKYTAGPAMQLQCDFILISIRHQQPASFCPNGWLSPQEGGAWPSVCSWDSWWFYVHPFTHHTSFPAKGWAGRITQPSWGCKDFPSAWQPRLSAFLSPCLTSTGSPTESTRSPRACLHQGTVRKPSLAMTEEPVEERGVLEEPAATSTMEGRTGEGLPTAALDHNNECMVVWG